MLAMFGLGHGFQFDMENNYRFVISPNVTCCVVLPDA